LAADYLEKYEGLFSFHALPKDCAFALQRARKTGAEFKQKESKA
jgi:hypothetical protein